MKRCPRCDRTYPDSETFCEADGTALVSAGPAFSESAGGGGAGEAIECPVCGGKAQPGELICNFCGARLGAESAGQVYTPPPPVSSSPGTSRVSRDPSSSMRFTGKMPEGQGEKSGRGMLAVLGYLLAAVIALGGGAWLALHLSSKGAEQPVANASPAAPVVSAITGPQVDLSKVMPVQVMGESASAPERNRDAVRKAFDDHKAALVESYSRALAGDGSLRDAMVVRVRVLPNGNVDAASVRTSINPNPGLDADVVKDVSAWTFPPSSGGQVEVDYPIIFTNDAATKDKLESDLSAKLANLSPTEAPEFASAPPGSAASPAASVAEAAPSPAIAPAPAESAAPVSPVAVATEAAPAPAVEPPPAPVSRPRRRNLNRELASREPVTPPPLTLQQRVKQVLSGNPKLRRVDCYTSGSTVTIFGKVFDYQTKQYAERVVRGVAGVGNVIDSLSTDESDWAARQAQIAQQLSNAGLNQVTVKVIGHDAYLGGTVKSDAEKNQAVTIAESASPIHVRGNLITVVPGNMFGF